MKRFLPVMILIIMLCGCASNEIREQFDESVESYNKSVRLLEWDDAAVFTAGPIRDEFKERAEAAGDVRMVDCQIINTAYNGKKREAVVDVEIEYYKNFSPVVKTIYDKQKWVYLDGNGTKGWKLMSLIPEFR